MSKRTCPFCKEKVKANATICKHCRSNLPALPPKKWYQTWKGFLLIMFILGIIAQTFEEEPITTTSSSQSPSVQSSPSPNKKLVTKINEKKALQDSYFGNFKTAKILKKTGTIILEVWQPWVQHVEKNFPPQLQRALLSDSQKLSISFDEIWTTEKDENLTETEKKEYKGQLDIIKLYWKKGEIQASTEEKFYKGNPLTGANLPSPAHKITGIYDRTYILKKLSKN